MDTTNSQIFITGSNLSCFVPGCPHTSRSTKRFIYLPKNHRKYWFEAVGRDDLDLQPVTSRLYVCEDHFKNPLYEVTASDLIETDPEDDIEEIEIATSPPAFVINKRANNTIPAAPPSKILKRVEALPKLFPRNSAQSSREQQKIIINGPKTSTAPTLTRVIQSKPQNPTFYLKANTSSSVAPSSQIVKGFNVNVSDNRVVKRIVATNRNTTPVASPKPVATIKTGKSPVGSAGRILPANRNVYQKQQPAVIHRQTMRQQQHPQSPPHEPVFCEDSKIKINKVTGRSANITYNSINNGEPKPEEKMSLPVLRSINGVFQHVSDASPTYIINRISKSIRDVTIEIIEKSPVLHLGLTEDRLDVVKRIVCAAANVQPVDLYITLKKLRLNEDFIVLADYFELTLSEIQNSFSDTIQKLARYLRFLVRWPEGKKYYDRHKNLPFAFRSKLSHVQSLIECVETEVRMPLHPSLDMIDCKNYKFILTITPAGMISYVSEAFVGSHDDLTIFNECNFTDIIPKYLSLVADPGDVLPSSGNDTLDADSSTDSADECDEAGDPSTRAPTKKQRMKSNKTQRLDTKKPLKLAHSSTMNVVNKQLISSKVKEFSIPALRVTEPACRLQIRHSVNRLREYKILQPYAVLEPPVYQHIDEILIIVSALTNLLQER